MMIITLNINGIQKKAGEVMSILENSKPDFLALQELRYNDLFYKNQHYTNFKNQLNKLGYDWIINGNVGLIYKKVYKIRSQIMKDKEGRIIGCEFERDGMFITIFSCYGPSAPTIKYDMKKKYMKFIDALCCLVPDNCHNLVVAGDFNMDINRDSETKIFGSFQRFLHTKCLYIKKTDPTFHYKGKNNTIGSSTLDYIMMSKELVDNNLKNIALPRMKGTSDHNPILAEFKTKSFKLVQERQATPNNDEAKLIMKDLEKINLNFKDNATTDDMLKTLFQTVHTTKEKHTKRVRSFKSYFCLNRISKLKLKDINAMNTLIHQIDKARKIPELDTNILDKFQSHIWEEKSKLNKELHCENYKQKKRSFEKLEKELNEACVKNKKMFSKVVVKKDKMQPFLKTVRAQKMKRIIFMISSQNFGPHSKLNQTLNNMVLIVLNQISVWMNCKAIAKSLN